MTAGIALHDGRASVSAVHTSDEATGSASALHIHGGGRVFDTELSAIYQADKAAGHLRCLYFYCRIMFRIVLILMVICEDTIHRQIFCGFTEKHAGISCKIIIGNLIIS